MEFSTIITKNLILRPMHLSDVDMVYQLFNGSHQGSYLSDDLAPNKEKIENFVKTREQLWEDEGYGFYLILDKYAEKQPIGLVGVEAGADLATIQYALTDKTAKQQYALEAMRALLKFIFTQKSFSCICGVAVKSEAAAQVFVDMGMRRIYGLNLYPESDELTNTYVMGNFYDNSLDLDALDFYAGPWRTRVTHDPIDGVFMIAALMLLPIIISFLMLLAFFVAGIFGGLFSMRVDLLSVVPTSAVALILSTTAAVATFQYGKASRIGKPLYELPKWVKRSIAIMVVVLLLLMLLPPSYWLRAIDPLNAFNLSEWNAQAFITVSLYCAVSCIGIFAFWYWAREWLLTKSWKCYGITFDDCKRIIKKPMSNQCQTPK